MAMVCVCKMEPMNPIERDEDETMTRFMEEYGNFLNNQDLPVLIEKRGFRIQGVCMGRGRMGSCANS